MGVTKIRVRPVLLKWGEVLGDRVIDKPHRRPIYLFLNTFNL